MWRELMSVLKCRFIERFDNKKASDNIYIYSILQNERIKKWDQALALKAEAQKSNKIRSINFV